VHRLSFVIGAMLFAVSATACGGGGDNGNPAAPSQQPFNQTITGTVSSFGTTQHLVNVPRGGNMRLSVSWVDGGDLDLYLTGTGCNAYPPTSCQILAASDGLSNPEVITRTVSSGEQFKAWVDSFVLSSARNYTLTINIQ
jgi:hypothetical protein